MQANGITNVAVCNQAAGGNAVLAGGLGPPLMERYQRDLLGVAGAKYALIFEGVNDIGPAAADSATQQRIGSDLTTAFATIASAAKGTAEMEGGFAAVIGATITPFGGVGQPYSDPAREETRQAVNAWILGGGEGSFDATVDFAAVLADPADPSILAGQYDGGDHLHPNVAGYQAMADGFPLEIFGAGGAGYATGRAIAPPSRYRRGYRGDQWLFAY